MNDALAPHRERYDQVAEGMRCFHASRMPDLRMKPINQLWRDREHDCLGLRYEARARPRSRRLVPRCRRSPPGLSPYKTLAYDRAMTARNNALTAE